MEAKKFINLLKKHKFTLLGVPLFVVAIAFVLLRKLPDVYTSKATLSAGLVDQSQQLLADKSDMQQEKVNQAFTNLIQMMQMRVIFDQVSYQLILHDLTSPVPYRPASKLMGYLNPSARKHATEVYTQHYKSRTPLRMDDKDENGLNQVLVSMKYDYGSLAKKVKIYRVENSDFVTVEYDADSPLLAAVVVNTLSNEFINYYFEVTKENELKSVNFLGRLLSDRKDSLNSRMRRLRDYKIRNRVLNLSEEAKSLYTQIADYESKMEELQKNIEANGGALKSINDKFNANDRQYMDSKLTSINQDILQSKQTLNDLNDEYVKSGFDSSYLPKINAQKAILTEQINQSTDKYIMNPLAAKESLIAQKMQLEVNQDLAKNSVKSIQDELNMLNKKFDQLVPNEAVIQSYESDISVTSQEYLEILNKYNETNLQYNNSVKVKLIEMAAIGEKQPSKKMLLIAVSGVVSFVFCLMVLFVLFYLDNSIQSPAELADKTKNSVLGHLPLLNTDSLDLVQLWQDNNPTPLVHEFKDQLRSVRFEIDDALTGPSIINITSLGRGEGKTLFAISLATAYLMTGKTVLLADGNFNHGSVTELLKPACYMEDYLTGKTELPPARPDELVVMGNRNADKSVFEIANEHLVTERMAALKKQFDIVLIESSGLQLMNKSKEWIKLADKVVGVFEANKALSADEKQEVKYLQKINDKFIGWVFNKLPSELAPAVKKSGFFRKKA